MGVGKATLVGVGAGQGGSLVPTRGIGVGALQSHEARPGLAVRVQKSFRKPEFEGMLGVIKNCYGDADYPALDVQLEDGRLELFWFHQVERVERRPAV